MGYDAFVALLIVAAIFLLVFYKKLEKLLDNKVDEQRKRKEITEHAHSLVMDIGNILENHEGIDQYQNLKPKLEQLKRYYRNNDNLNVVPIDREQQTEKEPVQLRVV
ncbi:hypothetical protein Q4489_04185 [Thalassotalea sp. 1_MG-2023]|uniref:hypothetical protein n=1 Tax=Thalassotalea sp. 1_MG-2023 TaxID=3062680 RepID=UPI0026E2FFA6|nr:hypothetical protein [Thalassotalea sp. 1_MG-2023]MDO6426195.1 hypothetical protein [Thalassotalea sp. 1_MG-2023]